MSDCWMNFGDIEIERNKWMVFRKEGGISSVRWFIFQTGDLKLQSRRKKGDFGGRMRNEAARGFSEQREAGWRDDG